MITGGAGVLTWLFGLWLESTSMIARGLVLAWFAAFGTASLVSAFGDISAHTRERPEALYLFLFMALLCVCGSVYVFSELRQQRKNTG